MIFKNTVWLAKLQMTIIYPNLLQKDKKWKILLIKGRQNWRSSLKKRRPTNFFFKFCHFRNYIFFLFELLKLPTSNMNNKMILFFIQNFQNLFWEKKKNHEYQKTQNKYNNIWYIRTWWRFQRILGLFFHDWFWGSWRRSVIMMRCSRV